MEEPKDTRRVTDSRGKVRRWERGGGISRARGQGHKWQELCWVAAPFLAGMSLDQSKDPSAREPCAEHRFMPLPSTQPSQYLPVANLVAAA